MLHHTGVLMRALLLLIAFPPLNVQELTLLLLTIWMKFVLETNFRNVHYPFLLRYALFKHLRKTHRKLTTNPFTVFKNFDSFTCFRNGFISPLITAKIPQDPRNERVVDPLLTASVLNIITLADARCCISLCCFWPCSTIHPRRCRQHKHWGLFQNDLVSITRVKFRELKKYFAQVNPNFQTSFL